jgi:sulfatase modifying factor 1
MYRQTCTVAAALAALASFTLAAAEQEKAANENAAKAASAGGPKAAGGAREASAKQITNSIGMKLTLVPSGEFMMGSGESAEKTAAFFAKNFGMFEATADWFKADHPQHLVRITKPFYLGTYHVTRGQFRQFVKDSGYKTDAEKDPKTNVVVWNSDGKTINLSEKHSWRKTSFEQTDEHPVVTVSWNDAVAFCKWLSKKESKTYRLPTEAEWEYASRAGTKTRYYCGDDPEALVKVANIADATVKAKYPEREDTIKASDGYMYTAPVGQFKPNAFGLYDMYGNAWQWCADWYDPRYYAKSPRDDPKGPESGNNRAVRGGSWEEGPRSTGSATRTEAMPTWASGNFGFRVARNP